MRDRLEDGTESIHDSGWAKARGNSDGMMVELLATCRRRSVFFFFFPW